MRKKTSRHRAAGPDIRARRSHASPETRPSAARSFDWPLLLVSLVLVFAVVSAYFNLGENGFLGLDDGDYVTDNRPVLGGLSWSGVQWAMTSRHAQNWHPLTWLSHMADVSLFGAWAGGHHDVNLGFHVLNTLLLLWLLRYTTGRLGPSAFVAALFALHPLHVESVAWIAERKDVLSTFLLFATMIAYAGYAKKTGRFRYAVVLVLFALGLMAKPMLVTLPVLLLLFDYWPLERLELNWTSVRIRALEKLPLMALSVASSVMTLVAQQGAIAPLQRVTMAMRLTNAVTSYGVYVAQMLWPSRLSVYYAYPAAPPFAKAAVVLALLAAATFAALWAGRRHKYVVTGWFWYLLTLVPVIGVVQVGEQAHADRYTYVSLTGLFIVVAWAVYDRAQQRRMLGLSAAAAGLLVVAAAGAATRQTVNYWRDDVTLFGHAVEIGERNRVTLGNMGAALARRGEVDKGIALLKETLDFAPHDARILMSIGSFYLQDQKLEESLQYHSQALAADPTIKEAQAGMAFTLSRLHRATEGLPYARKAVELDPTWAFGHNVLAMVLAEAGRRDDSVAAFRKAIELNPRAPEFYANLAALFAGSGELDRAAEVLREGVAASPDWRMFDLLGVTELQRGNLEEARTCFTQAVSMNPGVAATRVHLAVTLQRLGRTAEAVARLKEALLVDPANTEAQTYLRALTTTGNR
jgi:tetratricopeptide (TPR) repeat protein